jgi:peptidoglycan hydrolase-like protein with peptidoglycan-binding domain
MNDRTTASDTSGSSRASGDKAMASQSGGSANMGSSANSSSAAGTRSSESASTASARDRSGAASKDELRQAQTELKSMGLYDGEVDGIWGPRTRAAVGKFQQQHNLPQTYALDSRTRQQLQSQTGSADGRPESQIGETPSGSSSGTMEAPPIESPQPPQR